jgi:EAL and modified HD-GYP domain-containing signal transduction protein
LSALIAQLKPLGKKLLAEKVETSEQMTLCLNLGFDLFQGYFFARPTIIAGKKLNPSQLALIRLLGLLMEDAETSEVEQAFKLEPGLTVNMLRLTNSVGSGMSSKITSLRHAITVLGRRQLQRWVQLLIYTNPKGEAQTVNPLLQLAATRGRLMELLAERLHFKNREFADHAFMVGIMSLMPALLGVPMDEILAQLPVAQRVKQAFNDYSGQHGELLRLVEATEQTDLQAIEEALGELSGGGVLNAQFISNCIAQALMWANHLGQEENCAQPAD